MLRFRHLLPFALTLVAVACAENPPPPAETPAPEPPAPPPAAVASAEPVKPKEPEPPKPPTPAVRFHGAFATPESVYWDETADRYLVSNINGKPVDADNNGYISELSPDGKITNAKWIAAGEKKVKLDAPKGMAITGGVLYVADLTQVRMFDAKTGAPKGEIKIPGSTFLNDVAAGPGGKVYVSDSGMKLGEKGFEGTGTDAVYVIEKGKVKPLAKTQDLGRPNGLLSTDKGLLVTTFGSNEVYRLDDKGAKQDVTKLPKGSLDGIVPMGDSLLVSSWEASTVYKGKLGGTFEPVLEQLKAPADIGFDKKRNRVLVPRFMEDAVEAYDVK